MSNPPSSTARPDNRGAQWQGRPQYGARDGSAIRDRFVWTGALPAIIVTVIAMATVAYLLVAGAELSGITIGVLSAAVVACVITICLGYARAGAAGDRADDEVAALQSTLAAGQTEIRQFVEQLRRGERPGVTRTDVFGVNDEFALLAAELDRIRNTTTPAIAPTPEYTPEAGNDGRVGVFVNLARRLQSLVHREIQLLDELEAQVEDPDLLKGLFSVDHLATRIRRHAENLAVLGGAVSRRQWSRPVNVYEVLRSAVAEVEQYSRVKLVRPIEGTLQGHAVADVIHLVAELVENATRFSAPDTQVLLRAQKVTAGIAVEVEDRGLGVPREEQIRINGMLSEPDQINVDDLLQDGRIGLYVVSSLARRHGLAVQVQTNIYGGVQAVIILPNNLLGDATRPEAEPRRELLATDEPRPEPAALPAAPQPSQAAAETAAIPVQSDDRQPAPRHAAPETDTPAAEPVPARPEPEAEPVYALDRRDTEANYWPEHSDEPARAEAAAVPERSETESGYRFETAGYPTQRREPEPAQPAETETPEPARAEAREPEPVPTTDRRQYRTEPDYPATDRRDAIIRTGSLMPPSPDVPDVPQWPPAESTTGSTPEPHPTGPVPPRPVVDDGPPMPLFEEKPPAMASAGTPPNGIPVRAESARPNTGSGLPQRPLAPGVERPRPVAGRGDSPSRPVVADMRVSSRTPTGGDRPVSATPASGIPVSASPVSSAPVSASPVSGGPSGEPGRSRPSPRPRPQPTPPGGVQSPTPPRGLPVPTPPHGLSVPAGAPQPRTDLPTEGRPALPKRRKQTHLAPQLSHGPLPPVQRGSDADHNPNLMSAFQRGFGRGGDEASESEGTGQSEPPSNNT